jgi:hypothetical protein
VLQSFFFQVFFLMDILGAGASKSWTPLFICSQEGHFEVAKVLLAAGAKVDGTDVRGGYKISALTILADTFFP